MQSAPSFESVWPMVQMGTFMLFLVAGIFCAAIVRLTWYSELGRTAWWGLLSVTLASCGIPAWRLAILHYSVQAAPGMSADQIHRCAEFAATWSIAFALAMGLTLLALLAQRPGRTDPMDAIA